MNKAKWNMAVDATAFSLFLFLASTGFLLRWSLPPGSGRFDGTGGGRGAASRPVETLWGLSRHEWGDLHFYASIALLGILALHLCLHWRWIMGAVRGRDPSASGMRLGVGAAALVVLVAVAAAPLFAPRQSVPRGELRAPQSAETTAPQSAEREGRTGQRQGQGWRGGRDR